MPRADPRWQAHALLALAAQDLRVDLVGTGVEQLDGLILQLPYVTVRPKIRLIGVDTLARNQLRGFDSDC